MNITDATDREILILEFVLKTAAGGDEKSRKLVFTMAGREITPSEMFSKIDKVVAERVSRELPELSQLTADDIIGYPS